MNERISRIGFVSKLKLDPHRYDEHTKFCKRLMHTILELTGSEFYVEQVDHYC